MGSVSSGRGVSSNSEVVYTGASTSAPTAVGRTGQLVQFTDVNNSFWYSDGTNWKPVNGTVTLPGSRYPILIAPTGTFNSGSTGNVTFGTTLTNTYSGGLWAYLPTNASAGTTAGFYFVTMSSATVGTITGTSQSVANNSPDTTTAFTVPGGGPFAFTGDVTQITGWNWTIPAGILGSNYSVDMVSEAVRNASGTSSGTWGFTFGGQAILTQTVTTAIQSDRSIARLHGTGTGRQIHRPPTAGAYGTTNSQPTIRTVDTTAAVTVALTLQHNTTATDWVMAYGNSLSISL